MALLKRNVENYYWMIIGLINLFSGYSTFNKYYIKQKINYKLLH